MILEFDSKNKKTLFIIFITLLIAGIFYLTWQSLTGKEPERIFCTLDAKLCPDGSYVGRVAPTCEFAECPAVGNEPGWNTFVDNARGISFQYPASFSTKYISALDWPPQAQIIDGSFECAEAGSDIAPPGKTEKRIIAGKNYCVTTITQGAAGSIYSQYAYAFQRGDRVAIFTFTTRATQCGNYDIAQKTECENERLAFNLDDVVGRMANTLQFDTAFAPAVY